MFKAIFRDINSFKKELTALSKRKAFKTAEIKQHYVPNTVSMQSYMYALDKWATIDHAVSDMKGGPTSQLKTRMHEEQYGFKKREQEHDKKIDGLVAQVRSMVRETGIVQDIDDPLEKEEYELKRKRRLFNLFGKQLIQVVEQMKFMSLTPDMITHGNVFAHVPYQSGDESKQFFSAVKDGDLILVKKLLRNNRLLIYEFDESR
jgi:hypothetical protein